MILPLYWRLSLAQLVPVDAEKLVEWVDESFDVDSDEFKPQQQAQPGQPGMVDQAMQGQPGQPQPPQGGLELQKPDTMNQARQMLSPNPVAS